MEKKGTSLLPLHYGHPPEYLYKRMITLGGLISDLIIENYGLKELMKRFSDPFWFHSLSLAIGFDWNSSGTTVSTLSAIKDYYTMKKGEIRVAGGKGKKMGTFRADMDAAIADGFIDENKAGKIRNDAKKIGKIDNNLLLDGFDLYLQFVVFDSNGNYALVQQGMNPGAKMARRYHWASGFSDPLKDLNRDVSSDYINDHVRDISARESYGHRNAMVDVLEENPERYRYISNQRTLDNYDLPELRLDFRPNWKALRALYENDVKKFDDIYMSKGIGKSAITALSYIAEIIHGEKPSFVDPVKYSFTVGGKDGIPYPVNVSDYDAVIDFYKYVIHSLPLKTGEEERLTVWLRRYEDEKNKLK